MLCQKFTLPILTLLLFLLAACDQRAKVGKTTEVTYIIEEQEPGPLFWDYAASTNMLQAELSQLAKARSASAEVQAVADSTLALHTEALRRLRSIAQRYKHVQLPDSLTGADRTLAEDFKALEGDTFDTRYLEYLRLTHKTQLNRYQETLSETEDPALRRWLLTMRTQLQNRLQYYEVADSVLKKGGTTARY